MAGRPKGEKSFTQMLRIALAEASEDGSSTRLRDVAEMCVQKALDGDMQAIKEIGDRLDGKAIQQTDNHTTFNAGDTLTALLKEIAGNGTRFGNQS